MAAPTFIFAPSPPLTGGSHGIGLVGGWGATGAGRGGAEAARGTERWDWRWCARICVRIAASSDRIKLLQVFILLELACREPLHGNGKIVLPDAVAIIRDLEVRAAARSEAAVRMDDSVDFAGPSPPPLPPAFYISPAPVPLPSSSLCSPTTGDGTAARA